MAVVRHSRTALFSLPTATVPFSITAAVTRTVDGQVATMYVLEVGKMLAAGLVSCRERLLATKAGSPPSQFADLQCQSHSMSVSQHSLSLSVVPLFIGAIPWPTTPSILILSPTLNRPQPQLQFPQRNYHEITNEATAAHCSVPIAHTSKGMRRAHLLDDAVSS